MRYTTIAIDRDKCIGCGQCANACMQNVIAMQNGKAKVINDIQCDGLGNCIGTCPVDAIRFIQREKPEPTDKPRQPAGCPGTAAMQLRQKPAAVADPDEQPSTLAHWPIQLHLVRPDAPQFVGADVLLAASCTAFAAGNFHDKWLAGKGLIIACPKLDNRNGYLEKLTALFAEAQPQSFTVLRMTVPCCMGLTQLATEARERAGSPLNIQEHVIALQGDVIESRTL